MTIGPFCKALGINEAVLRGQAPLVIEAKSVSNGVIWELEKYKTAKKLLNKHMVEWLINIFKLKCENSEIVQDLLDKKLETLGNIRNTIFKTPHRYQGEIERLMDWNFDFPAEMGLDAPTKPFELSSCTGLGTKLMKLLQEKGINMDDSDDDEPTKKRKAREEINQLKKDLGSSKKVITALNEKISSLNESCKVLSDFSKSSTSERRRFEKDLFHLKFDWQNAIINWHDCVERLNKVNKNKGDYLDVGYMVRRTKAKQGIFDELNFEFEKTLDEFKHKINSLLEKEKKKKKAAPRGPVKGKSERKRGRQESSDGGDNNDAKRIKQDVEDTENKDKEENIDTSVDVKQDAEDKNNTAENVDKIAIDKQPVEIADTTAVDKNTDVKQEGEVSNKVTPEDKDLDNNLSRECKHMEIEESQNTFWPEDAIKTPVTASLEDFMNSEKVDEFKGGKFANVLKVVYTEMTARSVPCKCAHILLYEILDELELVETDKIPFQYVAADICMEGNMLTGLHVCADALHNSKASICNDGIAKFTLQDLTYEVTLSDGPCIKLGIRDISQGNPDTSLTSLSQLFESIALMKLEPLTKADKYQQAVKAFVLQNGFLERNIAEILFYYRQHIASLGNLSSMTFPLDHPFRLRVLQIGNFMNGVYFVLGLAQLVDVTVFVWEKVFATGDDSKYEKKHVNTGANPILSKTVQEIWNICSLVQDSTADTGVKFSKFMLNDKKQNSSPLAFCEDYAPCPINIIFHNSGGVWFFHESGILNEFSKTYSEKDKDPFSDLLKDKHSFAVTRVLGLIGKLVAVPLWTILEEIDNLFEIQNRYMTFLKKAEIWSKDASKFMKGQERLFEDVPIAYDAVYASLIMDNEATDVLTKELLEIMFTSFVPYIKHFLDLEPSPESTFTGPPQSEPQLASREIFFEDFHTFDKIGTGYHCFDKYALSAFSLYSKTKNGDLQEKFNTTIENKVIEFVKKDWNEKLHVLYERKIKMADILAKSQNLDTTVYKFNEKKYELVADLIKWGGLWRNEEEIDSKVKDLKEVDRLEALRAQLCYRRCILKESHDCGLLDLASEGNFFNSSKLCENLKLILKKEYELGQTNTLELATASDNVEFRQEIIEECLGAADFKSVDGSSPNTVQKQSFHWLLGKLVKHTFNSEQGKQIKEGLVVARRNLNGLFSYYIKYRSSLKPAVVIVPEGRIAEDYAAKNLTLLHPKAHDLENTRVSRAFIKDDGELEWHDCRVIGSVSNQGTKYIVEYDLYGCNLDIGNETIPQLDTLVFSTDLRHEYGKGNIRMLELKEESA